MKERSSAVWLQSDLGKVGMVGVSVKCRVWLQSDLSKDGMVGVSVKCRYVRRHTTRSGCFVEIRTGIFCGRMVDSSLL